MCYPDHYKWILALMKKVDEEVKVSWRFFPERNHSEALDNFGYILDCRGYGRRLRQPMKSLRNIWRSWWQSLWRYDESEECRWSLSESTVPSHWEIILQVRTMYFSYKRNSQIFLSSFRWMISSRNQVLYITQNPHCVIYTKISFSLQLEQLTAHANSIAVRFEDEDEE